MNTQPNSKINRAPVVVIQPARHLPVRTFEFLRSFVGAQHSQYSHCDELHDSRQSILLRLRHSVDRVESFNAGGRPVAEAAAAQAWRVAPPPSSSDDAARRCSPARCSTGRVSEMSSYQDVSLLRPLTTVTEYRSRCMCDRYRHSFRHKRLGRWPTMCICPMRVMMRRHLGYSTGLSDVI